MSSEEHSTLNEANNGKTKTVSPNNWEFADFAGNDDRKEKFLRLMGSCKKDEENSDEDLDLDKVEGAVHKKIDKELEQQFERGQEHKRLSGKHGHTGLGFKPEEEETQQESALVSGAKKVKGKDNNLNDAVGDNSSSNKFPEESPDEEEEEEEEEEEDEDEDDEDKSLDGEDDDDLSDEDEDEDDVEDDISDEEEEEGEVPSEAKKMKIVEKGH